MIPEFFEKLFGKNWRTSVYGILAILPQIANMIQQYLANIDAPKGAMDLLTLVFGIATVLNIKDKQVTGGKVDSDIHK